MKLPELRPIDKVTVDITAPHSIWSDPRILCQPLRETPSPLKVRPLIDVGADFYKLDTDAKGSSTPKAAAPETPKADRYS